MPEPIFLINPQGLCLLFTLDLMYKCLFFNFFKISHHKRKLFISEFILNTSSPLSLSKSQNKPNALEHPPPPNLPKDLQNGPLFFGSESVAIQCEGADVRSLDFEGWKCLDFLEVAR